MNLENEMYFETRHAAESYLKSSGYTLARFQFLGCVSYEKNRHVVSVIPEHDGNTANDRHYIDFNPVLAGY